MRNPPLPRIFWYEQRLEKAPGLSPLANDMQADVVVVGGGVAGLSCAQALSEQGRKVVLLEKGICGGGASGRSSGFITPDAEIELNDLIRTRGPENAKRLWEFVVGGVKTIRGNIDRHGINCDMQVQDSLFVANSRRGASVIQSEHAARMSFAYESTLYGAESVRSVLGSDGYFGGVRYPGTFGINAYLYCQAMREILRGVGVAIHEHSPVTDIGERQVKANGHTVRADVVVLCIDRFLPEVGVLSKDVYHAQTFLAVSAPLTDSQIAEIFPESKLMVWDTDLIYQYFRVTGDNRLLLGAASLLYTYGRQERTVAPRILRKMRDYVGKKFPRVRVEIDYFWPGLIGVSKDFLPLAAQDAIHSWLFYVSGAAGLPWATALGRYMGEKIQSHRSDFDADFDPHRSFPVGHFIQSVVGKPIAFALSHGIAKYFR